MVGAGSQVLTYDVELATKHAIEIISLTAKLQMNVTIATDPVAAILLFICLAANVCQIRRCGAT